MTPRLIAAASMLLLAAVAAPARGQGAAPAAPGAHPISTPAGPQAGEYLTPGTALGRELKGGEPHSYLMRLEAGQYLRVVVEQKGVDVLVRLFGPGGGKLAEVDSPNGAQGPEPVSVVAEEGGEYRLEVSALDRKAAAGKYEVRVDELRQATPRDRDWAAGEAALAEAQLLRNEGKAESLLAAVEKYKGALPLLRAAEHRRGEAHTLTSIGVIYWSLGENQKALDYYGQALPLWRALGDHKEEAVTIHNFGTAYWQSGDSQKALEYYRQALSLRREAGDREGEGDTLSAMGLAHSHLGGFQEALKYHNQALALRRAVVNRRGEANTLNNIGTAYEGLGEWQKALDYFGQSLPLWRQTGDRRGEAITLSNIGVIELQLGDPRRALERHSRALLLQRETGDRPSEASTLYNIGNAYRWQGDLQKALEYFNQALSLARAMEDSRGEAYILTGISAVHRAAGDPGRALETLGKSLLLRRQVGDRWGEAITLNMIGASYSSLGKPEEALGHLGLALSLSRDVGDRHGEAEALLHIAGAERDSGRFEQAREHIEASLDIGEQTRSTLLGRQQRALYSASRQKHYEFYIDLLMRMHADHPSAGHDAAALQASERARARGLLEMLTESGADIRQGADPGLLAREHSLRQQLAVKSERMTRLLAGRRTEAQGRAAAKEVNDLLEEYQALEGEIRARSPRYAALTRPRPLSAAEIQRELDPDTLLLEYKLGDERSYLWAVTTTSVTSFQLPKRSVVETQARRVHELLVAKAEALYPESLAELSRTLLAPVAGQLGRKRLVVVAEGALQYVPFGALPEPADAPGAPAEGRKWNEGAYRPLLGAHEIVTLPSASTLAVLRREQSGRIAAAQQLVVFADPVFVKEDVRVSPRGASPQPAAGAPEAGGGDNSQSRTGVRRAADDLGIARFERLPVSRKEAETIAAFVPKGQSLLALDFAASRGKALSPEMGRYRIIHFATHSLLNNSHPDLSGVVLSLFDEWGRPQDGFLRLHDIYNTKLGADLVVLSACQTALGQDIKGEGLVGLTRGFMYAGAPRVVASLWNVGDKATAELMRRFYQNMLGGGMRPAAALRAAQVSMSKSRRWAAPFNWAGFVLQGEWR